MQFQPQAADPESSNTRSFLDEVTGYQAVIWQLALVFWCNCCCTDDMCPVSHFFCFMQVIPLLSVIEEMVDRRRRGGIDTACVPKGVRLVWTSREREEFTLISESIMEAARQDRPCLLQHTCCDLLSC